MKVKVYELLRMLCEDELKNGERVVFNNYYMYEVKTKEKKILKAHSSDCEDSLLYFENLNKECELIDRK